MKFLVVESLQESRLLQADMNVQELVVDMPEAIHSLDWVPKPTKRLVLAKTIERIDSLAKLPPKLEELHVHCPCLVEAELLPRGLQTLILSGEAHCPDYEELPPGLISLVDENLNLRPGQSLPESLRELTLNTYVGGDLPLDLQSLTVLQADASSVLNWLPWRLQSLTLYQYDGHPLVISPSVRSVTLIDSDGFADFLELQLPEQLESLTLVGCESVDTLVGIPPDLIKLTIDFDHRGDDDHELVLPLNLQELSLSNLTARRLNSLGLTELLALDSLSLELNEPYATQVELINDLLQLKHLTLVSEQPTIILPWMPKLQSLTLSADVMANGEVVSSLSEYIEAWPDSDRDQV